MCEGAGVGAIDGKAVTGALEGCDKTAILKWIEIGKRTKYRKRIDVMYPNL